MKVTAKQTLKNSYQQVLFIEGKTYEVSEIVKARIFIPNEMHTETPFRAYEINKHFEVSANADAVAIMGACIASKSHKIRAYDKFGTPYAIWFRMLDGGTFEWCYCIDNSTDSTKPTTDINKVMQFCQPVWFYER